MCVYEKDNPVHFREAINSIINQTLMPDEIVLVVDGEIPGDLRAVIDEALKKIAILDVIYLEKNLGHGEARRIGVSKCKNSLVAIMDADDISLPGRFEKQIQKFKEDPSLSIVGGYIMEFIDIPDNPVGLRHVPKTDGDIKEYMKSRCPMNQMTVMFKKEAVEQAGGYIDWYCEEDYYLWLRMAQCGFKFENFDEVLVCVRAGDEMYRRRGGCKYFISEAKLQVYMFKKKIISVWRLIYNVAIRFVLQVAMPNGLRIVIYKKLARKASINSRN